MTNKIPRASRLVLFASSACILINLAVIVNKGAAAGYEISIYDVYPIYSWILFAIPLGAPFAVFAFEKGERPSYYAYLAIFCSLLSLFVFLSLAHLRGYFFYNGGDAMSHLGFIKEIGISGHFGTADFYPPIHIWIYSAATASQSDFRTVMLLTPPFFTCYYVISVFILSRALRFNARNGAAMAALAAIPVIGPELLSVFPSVEAFFLIPTILFLLVRGRDYGVFATPGFSIASILFLALFPFFHPETTLFLAFILLIVFISLRPKDRNAGRWPSGKIVLRGGLSIPILIMMAIFLVWFSSTIQFSYTINAVYNSLFMNSGRAPVEAYSSLLGRANLGFANIGILVIRIYGGVLIFVVISTIVTLRYFSKRAAAADIDNRKSLLVRLFAASGMILLVFLFVDLIIGTRPTKYLLFFSTLILGTAEGFWPSWKKSVHANSRIRTIVSSSILILLMMGAIGVSVMNTYPSPATIAGNWQVTQADFSGMEFYFMKRDQHLLTMEITISQVRFGHALLGVENRQLNLRYGSSTLPETHFGYDFNKSLGDFYTSDRYLLIDEYTELIYPRVLPDYQPQWKFSPEDFESMAGDSTVDLICNNGGLQILYVCASSP
jgi:hypothetical protein